MSALDVRVVGDGLLCRREIAVMRRLDRRGAVTFTDVVPGAVVFAALWRAIPALRPFGLAGRNPVVPGLLERLYLGFLRVRPALTRRFRR